MEKVNRIGKVIIKRRRDTHQCNTNDTKLFMNGKVKHQ